MSANGSQVPPSGRRLWTIAAAVVVILVGVVMLISWFSLRNDVSPQEARRLESLKNIAVARLENQDLKGMLADASFVEIADRLRDEPLGPRNLAITRLLELHEKLIEPAAARAAADRMLKVETSSVAALLLAGRIAKESDDEQRAFSLFSRAAELAPDDASAWYDLYQLGIASRDETVRQTGQDALGQAHRIAPTNLFLLGNWISEQADRQDSQIQQSLKTLRRTLEGMPGLVENVRKETRGAIADVLRYTDETLAAAARNEWPEVRRRANFLKRVILSQTWSKSDQRRVDKNHLEFVLHDFARLRGHDDAPDTDDDEPIAVSFAEFPAPWSLPELPGIADLELADFDLDGKLDLIVLREAIVEVYGRRDAPEGWRRIAECPVPPGFRRLLVADLDQDNPFQPGTRAHHDRLEAAKAGANDKPANLQADPCRAVGVDVIVYGPPGIALLRNEFDWKAEIRTLVLVPKAPPLEGVEDVLAVAVADVYHDGDLDLIVSTHKGPAIWSNRGDMTFVDVSGRSQMPPSALQASAIVPVDWDRDVDLDVLLAGPAGEPAGYLENLRHAQFRWRPFERGFEALSSAGALALLDSDGNGSWDLATAGTMGPGLVQTDVSRGGLVTQRASTSLGALPRTGILTWDYDNDGRQDLLAWAESGIDGYRGSKRGEFTHVPQLLARAWKSIRDCKVGDLDGDGDLDLAVAEANRVVLLSNAGGDANAWLKLRLWADAVDMQTIDFKANFHGIGSTIEVRAGGHFQRQSVVGQITHFGLGKRERPDAARVIWTTGVPQDIVQPAPDSVICDKQILSGSCPYLFTFNGERFEFCTDCLWSAPLGLQLADGVLAPSRSWEYLRIDGERLKPRDGVYRLQISEELWEAAYFDQVRLIAVDHPDEVEVYSNEKVGPAELAQHRIHTVGERRPPRAARDQRGRDVLPTVRHRDGKYLKGYDQKLGPGWAEEHFLELDLGPFDAQREAMLFLTGWIFPTGTSVNVGISQNPNFQAPRPPALWVPDAQGAWREVRSFMGFPGGKTKTIAIDLTDAFLCDDHRLRIATGMEIYWDEAFFTVDEPEVAVEVTPLALTSAEMHYRGFSRRTPGEHHGPDHYDYDDVQVEPIWPAMEGFFTRYGPVDELLTATDDLLVIMGSGDELTLEFAAPPAPRPGWKRDFLLYNVGWDKDADLNTVYGQTVEPLPFGAMSGYPYAGEEDYPDTPRHREYLRTYQTRRQDPLRFWRQVSGAPPAAK
ncbi:MAG TPA: FG-GAP-like repeat-containing protein [Pirellulales bacterium]|nr:FG-GAP-like repeat-containing protein [Pirellulales bacterium]